MTKITPARERLWFALMNQMYGSEPPLSCIVALLAEIRHWCDRNDHPYHAVNATAHELFAADIERDTWGQP